MNVETDIAAPPGEIGRRRGASWRSAAAVVLKLALSAGVLAFAWSRIEGGALREALARLDPAPLAAALASLLLAILAVAARWSLLTQRYAPIGLRDSTAITFAAQLVGQVLPSSLGQDAVRAWYVRKRSGPFADAVAIILLDRICGVMGLCVLILVMLPMLAELGGAARGRDAAVAAFSLAGAAVTAAVLLRVLKIPAGAPRLVMRCADAARHAGVILTSRPGLLAVAASIAVQGLVVLSVWMIALSLESPLSLVQSFATVPAAIFVSMLPISINGWGVREGAMVVSLGMAGVPASEAFLISVIFGVALLCAALPGVVALAAYGNERWSPKNR